MLGTVFMEINDDFISLVKKLAEGRTIIDCGAGMARFGSLVPEVISIDRFPEESPFSRVIEFDAVEFNMGPKFLPMFIRPDHGGWVHKTLEKQLPLTGLALYVGFESNFATDLPDEGILYLADEIEGWTGPNGEKAFRVVPVKNPPQTEEWRLLQIGTPGYVTWMKVITRNGCLWYENLRGGRSPPAAFIRVLDVQHVRNARNLDWKRTYLSSDESGAGWLDRAGTLHTCPPEEHDNYAFLVLKRDVDDLERAGWVRVLGPPGPYHLKMSGLVVEPWMLTHGRLSVEQARWLDRRGYTIPHDDDLPEDPSLETE